MTEIKTSTVAVGPLTMRVAGAGTGDPVVFLHGFPELWYSWRHQLSALSDAGYRAIAPNQRGYDGTTAPVDVGDYDIEALTGDVVGLLDALELEDAVVIGHDWGAVVAWSTALLYPARVRAVGALSVPHTPLPPMPYTQFWKQLLGDDFYMLWLQEPGVADAEFAADVPRALAGAWVTDRDGWRDTPLPRRPPWRTQADEDVYVEALTRSGFTGGLNWYRNFDRNRELLLPYEDRTIDQPALFIAGSEDPVGTFMPPQLMQGRVTDLREQLILPGVNHWPQQESPAAVTRAILTFLDGLD